MATILKLNETLQSVKEIFKRAGFREEYAADVADNLVTSEARGVRSHGLLHVPGYIQMFKKGKITNNDPEIIRDFRATAAVDAHFSPGASAGNFGMDLAIQKAQENGVGMVTVKNGTHFGAAYLFAKRAVEADLIGLSFTNAGDMVAPYGGRTRQVGTNPICIAAPSAWKYPLVYDGATSVQAFNKCIFASVEKKKIPKGWIIDKNGNDTTDPDDAFEGALLPFGGYKGYGLGVMVNVLTGFLSGSSIDHDQDGNFKENIYVPGYHFVAIDISRFTDVQDFKEGLAVFAERIKNSPKRNGTDEIFLPGEIEFRNEEEAKKNGLKLYDGVFENLKKEADEYDVLLPVVSVE